MVGRERSATLKKVAESLALVWAFSSERILPSRIDGKTVDGCFSRENARFPLAIVVRQLAPHIQSAAGAQQGINSVVRKLCISVQLIRIRRESGRNGQV